MFIIGTGRSREACRRHSGRAAAVRHGRRLGGGERDAENGIGAEPALVGRAVERDHGFVDLDLRLGLHAAESVENLAIDGVDGFAHALAEIALACRRRAVRPLRARRSRRQTARRRGRATPSSRMTSTSTVGLPRLSRISRPMMSTMAVMTGSRLNRAVLPGLLQDRAASCHARPKQGMQCGLWQKIRPNSAVPRRSRRRPTRRCSTACAIRIRTRTMSPASPFPNSP